MSDLIEVAKVLVSPVEKLMDLTAIGVGKVYEPTNIRRMAKAKAEELRLIRTAIADGLYIPTKYENGEITIDTSEPHELIKRAQQRFLFQETQKQQNIESVVANAYDILKDEKEVSQEPVDKDWILRFFNSVEDISNEDMQKLWGKILAGEIKKPKSVSLRTLEVLKNMTADEAILFEEILEVAVDIDEVLFTLTYRDYYKPIISYDKLVELEECGLLSLTKKALIPKGINNNNVLVSNDTLCLKISLKYNEEYFELIIFNISVVGSQIAKIIGVKVSDDNLKYFGEYLKANYSEINVSLHQIISRTSKGEIEYSENDLLE